MQDASALSLCEMRLPDYSIDMSQCPISPRTHGAARFFLTAVGIAASGLVCALVLVLAVSLLMRNDSSGFGALGLALGAAMLGYPLGGVAGLFLLRRVVRMSGWLLLGIIGAFVGAAVPVGIASIANGSIEPDVLIGVYFVSVPVLCAIGFLARAGTVSSGGNAKG